MFVRINSLANPWGGLFAKRSSGTTMQLGIGRNDTTTNVYASVRDDTTCNFSSVSTGSIVGVGFIPITVVYDGSATAYWYQSGALVGDTSAAGSLGAQNNGTGTLVLGAARDASNTYDSDADWLYFGWRRGVPSAQQIARWHANLWSLFAPIERRIWVPVSAGSGTQTLTPDLFTNSNTFYTHTVTTGAVTLTPDLVTNTNSFYTPTVSSSYTVTPNLFTNTNTFYTPVVTNLSTLYPDLFTNSQTFYTHVVTGGGGQTLEPELFSNSATFYGPTITVGSVTLTASLFTNTNDIYSHTVTSNYPLTPDLFSNSSSFYTPTISVGAVTLTPSLFTNSSTFYTHTISNSSTTIYFWKRTA